MNRLFIKKFNKLSFFTAKKSVIILYSVLFSLNVFASPINIIAAENFYGSIAREIGGSQVTVQNILNNPNADPHLFSTSVATSKAISQAQIIIYNGSNYDSWIMPLLQLNKDKNRVIINVSDLIQVKSSNNPHIWYNPETSVILAKYLTTTFISLDKQNTENLKKNLATFLKNNQVIQNKIAKLKSQFANTPITATEPVFNYMADALGLKMYGLDFQWKIMNGTEPAPKILAAYNNLIINKQVALIIYNSQVNSPIISNVLKLCKKYNIQTVGVTETMPTNYAKFSDWVLAELNSLETALKLAKLDKGNK